MTPQQPIIGLIGAIGAGKSTAGRALAVRGATVIDCDRLGHVALDLPQVLPRLVSHWGAEILTPDGRVNRKKLGLKVFADPQERLALESIVFPVIAELTQAEIDAARQSPHSIAIILDAATLLEAGWADKCDRILYVDAPRNLRLTRLRERSGWDDAELARREAAQLPAEIKKRQAHAIIVNDGSEHELQAKIDAWLTEQGLLADPATTTSGRRMTHE
jgi:dephospho-CoA kinase